MTLQLTGEITPDGELKVELPDGLPPGQVNVILEFVWEKEVPWELRP